MAQSFKWVASLRIPLLYTQTERVFKKDKYFLPLTLCLMIVYFGSSQNAATQSRLASYFLDCRILRLKAELSAAMQGHSLDKKRHQRVRAQKNDLLQTLFKAKGFKLLHNIQIKVIEMSHKKYTKIPLETRERLIYLCHEEGITFKKAAEIHGLHQSTVRMIVRKYQKEGKFFEKKEDKMTRETVQKALEDHRREMEQKLTTVTPSDGIVWVDPQCFNYYMPNPFLPFGYL